MNLIEEQLYPIKGYEELYAITKSGKVWSYGNSNRNKYGLYRKTHINHKGYMDIILTKNGKRSTKFIHRLLALTFIPNHENKREVNHKNGIKTDNRIENLEWCTSKENIQHSWKIGLREHTRQYSSQNAHKMHKLNRKFNNETIILMRDIYKKGLKCISDLSKEYDISQSAMTKIVRYKSYKDIA